MEEKWKLYSGVMCQKVPDLGIDEKVRWKSPGSAVRPTAKSPGFGISRHNGSERIIRGPREMLRSFRSLYVALSSNEH